LIKVGCLRRTFDGEEGFNAGVQVEDLTGPAGPDRLGVGVLEAVHPSQLITLRLVAPAQREVEMPRQILIADPPITWLAVGFGEP
jgi:hypothetical protein